MLLQALDLVVLFPDAQFQFLDLTLFIDCLNPVVLSFDLSVEPLEDLASGFHLG